MSSEGDVKSGGQGDQQLSTHCCSLKMRLQHQQNDIVCTAPPMLETAAKRPNVDSPTGDESRSCRPPFFPSELISEILLKLPVKSLLRFRCVSKSWKTLISDPQFAKDHLRTSIADPNMTNHRLVASVFDEECKILSWPLESLFQNLPSPPETLTSTMHNKFQILGSCNGLLCLFDVGIDQGYVRLWNTSTRCRSQRVPVGNGVCIDSRITYHGFGYDHLNDKYKLLVVSRGAGNAVSQIFTFGANSWTTIQNFPDHRTCRLSGKYVSGTLNWIAKRHDCQWVIFSLDLGKESFSELLLPEREGDRIGHLELDVLRDSLCFCYFNWKNQWVVWLMKEYGVQESWTKFRVIPGIWLLSKWGYFVDSLCIFENGVLLKTSFSHVLLFNTNDGRLVYPWTSSKAGLDLHICHDSLILPPLC